ncbi:MAG TPA: vWA domain-containing protein [Polyangiaceae bacterium]|nr:vWA domain-containing protein [Polyangiaceae bacterium]
MASHSRLFARIFQTSLPLMVACSTGHPPTGDTDFVTTGGSSGSAAKGGSSGSAMGGSAASATGGSASSGASGTGTGGSSGDTATGGSAGDTAATGGDTSLGGSSGASATGGDAGAAAMGGTAGSAASGAMGGTAGTDPGICQSLSVVPMKQVPTVEILVDDSSSMYEPENMPPTPWEMLYAALMDPTNGAIKPLQDQVRFGFASFRSPKNHPVAEDDPTCAEMQKVPFALSNFDAIDTVYAAVGKDARFPKGCGDTPNTQNCQQTSWDTPTDYAINVVASDLLAFTVPPAGKKYILFVTDGTPNTCEVGDPNCGQDLAIAAVQKAFTAGIGTYVIGVGDIIDEANTGNCDPQAGRCGSDHLQDIANAGTGQAVAPPPASFWYSQCAAKASGMMGGAGTPQSTYVATEAEAGTAKFYTAKDAAELKSALTGLLNNVISCTVDMDAIVVGDPSLGMVDVGGTPATYDDANGWKLEANSYSVTLQGTSCEAFKSGGMVNINFPCDPNGGPIAVHR